MPQLFITFVLIALLGGCDSKPPAQQVEEPEVAEEASVEVEEAKPLIQRKNAKLKRLKNDLQGTMDKREGNLDQKINEN